VKPDPYQDKRLKPGEIQLLQPRDADILGQADGGFDFKGGAGCLEIMNAIPPTANGELSQLIFSFVLAHCCGSSIWRQQLILRNAPSRSSPGRVWQSNNSALFVSVPAFDKRS
jgi:hypothetical protein